MQNRRSIKEETRVNTKAGATKKRWYRIAYRTSFTLLSLWVHFAVWFFVTMNLFAGSNVTESTQAPMNRLEAVVTVELPPQPVPKEDPAPVNTLVPDPANTENRMDQTLQPPPTPKQTTPPLAQVATPSDKSAEATPKEGILSCDSLTKKPQRIELGSGELGMQLKNAIKGGSVVLHIALRRDGTVLGVNVEQSTVEKKLETAIVDYAYRSLFTPGELDGVAVDCDMKFEIVPEGDAPLHP